MAEELPERLDQTQHRTTLRRSAAAFTLLLLLAALTISCASTPIFGNLSPQAAAREAWRDIASGKMKLYRAGTEASSEVGVEPEDQELVRRLPRNNSLPQGCTNPEASAAVEYARAYNVRIVRYLRLHHPH